MLSRDAGFRVYCETNGTDSLFSDVLDRYLSR